MLRVILNRFGLLGRCGFLDRVLGDGLIHEELTLKLLLNLSLR